uniref:Uncharacterized protein n=1 Tax=Chenopodium quinoa TaxID=63459 RepID=A0A803MM55_CHEQI
MTDNGEVNVGEESYKTPAKGKSTVAITFEIEELANVEVSLLPPDVGMVFDSWKKIDKYFRNYGKQEGFGVVWSSGTFVGKGANAKEKKSVTWTCECFGMPGRKCKKTGPTFVSDSQICEEVCVKRKSKKVQCSVKLYAKVNEVGDWVIDKAELEHKGVVGTPSSVCAEKKSTPSTQRHGSREGGEEGPVVHVTDPPMPKGPAHWTTDSRYKSCLEKPKKAKTTKDNQGNNKNRNKKGSQSEVTPPSPFQTPISQLFAASTQSGYIPILPRPRPPVTPPPHSSQRTK